MTLVNAYLIGENTCVLTCDTRQVLEFAGHTVRLNNKETKIALISENIIACGGGYDRITDFIREELIKESPRNITDCFNKLSLLAKEVKIKFETFLNRKDIVAQFAVIGFEPDSNRNWIVRYVLGDDVEVAYSIPEEGAMSGITYVPSQDDLQKASENVGELNFTNLEDTESLTFDLIEYFSLQQKYLYKMDPEAISEEFCYRAIRWDRESNKHVHYSGKFNLNEIEIA